MDRDTKSKFQLALKSQKTVTYSKLRRNKLDFCQVVLMFFKQLLDLVSLYNIKFLVSVKKESCSCNSIPFKLLSKDDG